MKKLAALAVVPLFAGYLCATPPQQSETTTTTTTTWNGTLLDAGCYTTHTKKTESNSEANSTTKTETTKITTECPVTTTTTTFGMLTPEGRVVRFDDPSNTRVIEMVKSNKSWNGFITEHKPIRVRVVGTGNGDVVVVKEIR